MNIVYVNRVMPIAFSTLRIGEYCRKHSDDENIVYLRIRTTLYPKSETEINVVSLTSGEFYYIHGGMQIIKLIPEEFSFSETAYSEITRP